MKSITTTILTHYKLIFKAFPIILRLFTIFKKLYIDIFDGEKFDSGVMIRFIEITREGLKYKSGGGITAQSLCEEEYNELIEKIYVPFT